MSPLPTDRTTANTPAEHVADHNALHAEYNTPTHTHSGTYEWAAYAPTWTNLTVGNGTVVARWVQIGDVVHFTADLIFGTTTSVTGAGVRISLPVAAIAGRRPIPAIYNDSGTRIFVGMGWAGVADASSLTLYHTESGDSGQVAATAPFTWTTGDRINVAGTYEAA